MSLIEDTWKVSWPSGYPLRGRIYHCQWVIQWVPFYHWMSYVVHCCRLNSPTSFCAVSHSAPHLVVLASLFGLVASFVWLFVLRACGRRPGACVDGMDVGISQSVHVRVLLLLLLLWLMLLLVLSFSRLFVCWQLGFLLFALCVDFGWLVGWSVGRMAIGHGAVARAVQRLPPRRQAKPLAGTAQGARSGLPEACALPVKGASPHT